MERALLLLLLGLFPHIEAKVVLHVVSPIQGSDDACADACKCNATSSLRYNLTCEFVRLHPDIEVRFRKAGWGELFGAVEKAAFSVNMSERADIVYVGSTWMLDLVKRGVVLNLQPYLNDLRLTRPRGDLTLEFARQCEMDFKINGDYWAIPCALGSRTLFYRRDLYKMYLNKTSPPETLQEMWDNGLRIQREEKRRGRTTWGYVTELEHNLLQHLLPFYLGFGGSLLNRTGGCGFRTPEFKEAMAMLNDMYQSPDRKVMPDEFTGLFRAQDIFKGGGAVHLISGGWNWWDFKDLNLTGPEPSFHVAQTPAGPKGRFAFLGADAWAITGTSPHPDEAWKFLQFLTDPDGAHFEIVKSEGAISPYNRLWPLASHMVHMQTQVDQLPYSFSQYFPTSGNFWMPRLETNETVGKMVRRVLRNEMTISQSAEAACAEMDLLFCCDPVPLPLVRTEFSVYLYVVIGAVVFIVIVVVGMWSKKYRQANALYSNSLVAERCAESIAAMRLEEVEYITTIKRPNRIQKAFIQIIENLHEYRLYLPHSVRASFDDDFEDGADDVTQPVMRGFDASEGKHLPEALKRLSEVPTSRGGSPKASPRHDKSSPGSPHSSFRRVSLDGASEGSTVASLTRPPASPMLTSQSTHLSKVQATQDRRNVAIAIINLIDTMRMDNDTRKKDRLCAFVSVCVAHTVNSKGVLEGVTGDRARCSWNASRPCVRFRVHSLTTTMRITQGPTQLGRMSAAVTSGEALCGAEGAMDFRYYLIDGPKIAYSFVLERLAAREVAILEKELGGQHSVVLCDASTKQDTTEDTSHRCCGLLSYQKVPRTMTVWHAIQLYDRGDGQEWMYELAGRSGQEVWHMYNNAMHRITNDSITEAMAHLSDCTGMPPKSLAEYYTEKLKMHIVNKTKPGVMVATEVGLSGGIMSVGSVEATPSVSPPEAGQPRAERLIFSTSGNFLAPTVPLPEAAADLLGATADTVQPVTQPTTADAVQPVSEDVGTSPTARKRTSGTAETN
eukprot:Hpha_TRINITY_DN16709_c3_g7::TRINITY_DN16709_c3_g7_i1::g.78193::m.78193